MKKINKYIYKYLVTGNEIFPLALTLFSAAIVTLFSHAGSNNFPEKFIPFGFHKGWIEFGPNHEKIPCFLNTPLRKPISATSNADTTTATTTTSGIDTV